MPKPTKPSIVELKARAYETVLQINQLQANLNKPNELIVAEQNREKQD